MTDEQRAVLKRYEQIDDLVLVVEELDKSLYAARTENEALRLRCDESNVLRENADLREDLKGRDKTIKDLLDECVRLKNHLAMHVPPPVTHG